MAMRSTEKPHAHSTMVVWGGQEGCCGCSSDCHQATLTSLSRCQTEQKLSVMVGKWSLQFGQCVYVSPPRLCALRYLVGVGDAQSHEQLRGACEQLLEQLWRGGAKEGA